MSFYRLGFSPLSNLRLWVDILTPKQVLFFGLLTKYLREQGHEVLVTARHYREVDQLAKTKGLHLEFVGKRGGKEVSEQLRASLDRMRQLLPLVEQFGPDASVSVASADCARISFGLRIKHVAVNDSPHSAVAAKLSLPLSHHLLAPWLIPYEAWTAYGIGRKDITRYRALDPAAWLKRMDHTQPSRLDLSTGRPTAVVRLEESYAPYMIGTDRSWGERLLEKLVPEFNDCNIVLLSRYENQLDRMINLYADRCIVPKQAVDGLSLLDRTDLFVGMGGTMTTEAALMGVPAISAYQGDLLYTEKYLLGKGILKKSRDPNEIVRLGRRLLRKGERAGISKKAKSILDSMEDPIERITDYLQTLAA